MARRGARAAGAGMGRCSEDRKRLRSDIPEAARWARREPSRGGRAFQRPMSTSSRTARGCEKSRLVVSRVGLSTENGLGPARLGCGHAHRVRGDDDGGQAGAGTVRTWLSSRNTLGAVPPGPFGSVRLLESSSLVLFSVACSRDAPAGWRCAHPPYESRVLHRTPQSSAVPLSYPFHHEEARAARSDDIMHKFPRACCGARRRRRDHRRVRAARDRGRRAARRDRHRDDRRYLGLTIPPSIGPGPSVLPVRWRSRRGAARPGAG